MAAGRPCDFRGVRRDRDAAGYFASPWSFSTDVLGYSAAQAYHLTITPGSHRSVCPFRGPETARPSTDHREPVSLSTHGAAASLASTASVTNSPALPSISGA